MPKLPVPFETASEREVRASVPQSIIACLEATRFRRFGNPPIARVIAANADSIGKRCVVIAQDTSVDLDYRADHLYVLQVFARMNVSADFLEALMRNSVFSTIPTISTALMNDPKASKASLGPLPTKWDIVLQLWCLMVQRAAKTGGSALAAQPDVSDILLDFASWSVIVSRHRMPCE